jgi:myo-inositol-1(or 4)-monophosphatase
MQMPNLPQLLEEVIDLSRTIGSWMLEQQVSADAIETKSFNNLVSYVDKESEKRFVDALQKLLPGSGFIAEEGTGKPVDGGLNWIIDPLDGTTNYLHHFPSWCTSVALHSPDGLLLGVIYDPNRDEVFSAVKDGGAHLNGKPIQVRTTTSLQQSLLATGFPYDDFGREAPYHLLFQELTRSTRGLRRPGSAALDLAYVAKGSFELFYEYGLNPWDVAAGILIVREAGGEVTGFDRSGDPLFGEDIVASNGAVHAEMLERIAKYF